MKHCYLNCSLILVIGLFYSQNSTAEDAEKIGTATCNRPSPGEECLIAWNFTATPRAYYWVEKFLRADDTATWQSVAGPFSGQQSVTDNAVEGGFLYRVVGCRDKAKSIDCVGSTAYWAPLRPKNMESIPERIVTREGYYLRQKNLTELEQVVGFNYAMLRKLVLDIDLTSMPAMTEPLLTDWRHLTDENAIEDATIDYNIYMGYPIK